MSRAWGRVLVGLGVVVGLGATPPARALSSRQPSDLDRWLAAVASHEPGHNDGATNEIDPWSRADLMNGVMSRLRNVVKEPARSVVLKRAAMLHTDIAMIRVLTGQFVTTTPLGMPLRATYQTHLEVARQLLEWVEPDPKTDPDVQAWYRASTAWLLHHYLVVDLQPHLEKARGLFPDDAATARDSGTAAETLAAAAIQNSVTRQGQILTPGTRMVVRSPETHLSEAERYFRRAVAIDPDLVEAHVRLGRTLDALGRPEAALEHLDRARAGPAEPVLLYFAHLLAAHALESRRDPALARAAYERASALYPRAQSPLLSLARLADAAGDRGAARALADRVLDLPWSDREREDPWWIYHQGIGRDAAALVDRLRERIASLPRIADEPRAVRLLR